MPKNLSSSRKIIALCLSLTLYVLIGLNDTFWTPFLPSELSDRGVSKSVIGIIVSASDAAGFISGVYFMFFFKNIQQRKFLLCFGDFIIGIACLLFCQLHKAASGTVYVLMCIATRSAMGCGITLIWCSGAPLLIAMFPKSTGSICSWISGAISIGIISGAPLGSLLYASGGYALPFYVVGGLQIVLPVLFFIGIPDQKEALSKSAEFSPTCKTALKFLSNSGVIFISIAATFAASSLGLLAVAFSPYLEARYSIGSTKAGSYYLPFTILRAVSAPLIGYMIDKGFAGVIFTFMGCLLTGVGFFIIYISQYFSNFLGSLAVLEIVIAIIGLSSTSAFIPLIPLLRKIYPVGPSMTLEMVDNYAAIMYSHCFALGLAIGESVIAGIILDKLGFYSSCMSMTIVCTITGLIGVAYLYNRQLLFSRIEQPQYDVQVINESYEDIENDNDDYDDDVPMISS